MNGFVMYFDKLRGEGLVKAENGLTCFLHYSSLPGYSRHSHVSVKELAPIEFDIVDGFKGPQAHNVKYIEDKTTIEVCEDVIMRILEQPDDDLYFGKNWRLNNWITSLGLAAKDNGYLIYGPFWENQIKWRNNE